MASMSTRAVSPSKTSGRLQYKEDMARGARAIDAFLKTQPSRHAITVTLSYRKSTEQFHVYANHALKMHGIYVPKEMLSAKPPGRIELRLEGL